MKKTILAIVSCFILATPLVLTPVHAQSVEVNSIENSYEHFLDSAVIDSEGQAEIDEMIHNGVTSKNAKSLYLLDGILSKMEQYGEKVDLVNDEIQFVTKGRKASVLTNEEQSFVTQSFLPYIGGKNSTIHITSKQKMQDLQTKMEDEPGKQLYRVDYNDGSWVQAVSVTEPIAENNKSKAYMKSTSFPNEIEDGTGVYYPYGGTFDHTYTLTENAGAAAYASNFIKVNYTVSSDFHHVKINKAENGQASHGIFFVQNSGKYINVQETDYNVNPTLWCEAESQVVFGISGGVGVTLAGVFSVNVNAGYNWTQYAITRLSLVAQHDYAAYYV